MDVDVRLLDTQVPRRSPRGVRSIRSVRESAYVCVCVETHTSASKDEFMCACVYDRER